MTININLKNIIIAACILLLAYGVCGLFSQANDIASAMNGTVIEQYQELDSATADLF